MQLLKLIQLYFYVCEVYEEQLKWHCQRFTKNQQEPDFTDEELITSYLHCVGQERRLQISDIHHCLRVHYLDCFPTLPSYEAYNNRLNRLASAFPVLVEDLLYKCISDPDPDRIPFMLTDSMPIITCQANRRAKVARELCDKGYNATKKMYFHGVKLHVIGERQAGSLPRAKIIQVGVASQNDLEAQRGLLEQLSDQVVFADKAFCDSVLKRLFRKNGGELLTPVKYKRGQSKQDKQRHLAADQLYSTCVSSIKQPIESFFNWLIQHVDIQRASKVRSTKGLLVHLFGKIAAAIASKTNALGMI